MKKSITLMFLGVLILGFGVIVFAEDIMTEEDEARFGLAQSLGTLKRCAEAVKILEELHTKFPSRQDITVELISSLYGAGMDKDAQMQVKNLLDERKHEPGPMMRLLGILTQKKGYKDAIKLCQVILAEDPSNKDARLWLARILSWNGKYKDAKKTYDELINNSKDWPTPRREKARVLGWEHEYAKSINEYKSIIKDIIPTDEASSLEMRAKDAGYKYFDIKAIKAYQDWLAVEPDDLEALFDLAQAYSRNMQWKNARGLYEKVLVIMPDHASAKTALEKTDIYSKSFQAEIGMQYYTSASTSRDIDQTYWDIYAAAKIPVLEELYLSAREDTFIHYFSKSKLEWAVRERLGLAIEYNLRPFFWAKAGYAYSIYSSHFNNTHNFNGELNFRPVDGISFTFLQKREDVLDNQETLNNSLKRDDYKIRALVEPNRRISLGADYMYSHYTDTNDKFTYGIDLRGQILYEPHSLAVTYRYEEYGFGQPSSIYFSPYRFHYNTVGFELRQFLNKKLFWGNNDTYYTLKYAVNFDVHDQVGHTLYADFHKDWTKNFSTHIEWTKKIYEHRDTYGEEGVLVYGKLNF